MVAGTCIRSRILMADPPACRDPPAQERYSAHGRDREQEEGTEDQRDGRTSHVVADRDDRSLGTRPDHIDRIDTLVVCLEGGHRTPDAARLAGDVIAKIALVRLHRKRVAARIDHNEPNGRHRDPSAPFEIEHLRAWFRDHRHLGARDRDALESRDVIEHPEVGGQAPTNGDAEAEDHEAAQDPAGALDLRRRRGRD